MNRVARPTCILGPPGSHPRQETGSVHRTVLSDDFPPKQIQESIGGSSLPKDSLKMVLARCLTAGCLVHVCSKRDFSLLLHVLVGDSQVRSLLSTVPWRQGFERGMSPPSPVAGICSC